MRLQLVRGPSRKVVCSGLIDCLRRRLRARKNSPAIALLGNARILAPDDDDVDGGVARRGMIMVVFVVFVKESPFVRSSRVWFGGGVDCGGNHFFCLQVNLTASLQDNLQASPVAAAVVLPLPPSHTHTRVAMARILHRTSTTRRTAARWVRAHCTSPPQQPPTDPPHQRWRELTSLQNPKVKLAKHLHAKRGRDRNGELVLLEGHRLVCDALEEHPQHASHPDAAVLVGARALGDAAPDAARLARILDGLDRRAVFSASEDVLRAISTTETPQPVAAILPRPARVWPAPGAARLVLVCDGVSDPGNLGTLVRSAAATACGGVLLLGPCADPWGPKALRAAMGATFRVPILRLPSFSEAIAANGPLESCAIFAADAKGEAPYHAVDWAGREEGGEPPQTRAVVVGSEAHGLSPAVWAAVGAGRARAVAVPTQAVESLNAAVAGSVILCEAHRQILQLEDAAPRDQ